MQRLRLPYVTLIINVAHMSTKAHTLQGQLAAEQHEKKEVMAICDELVKRLEEQKK